MMGGSVHIESVLGEGSTFVVQLKTKCKYVFKDSDLDVSGPKRSSQALSKYKFSMAPENTPK